MQYTDAWKRRWPIGSVSTPPLLSGGDAITISKTPTETKIVKDSHGPLCFNSYPKTTILVQQLFSPPSSLLPPFPSLTLPRFLSRAEDSSSSLLPSAAASIANSFLRDELISSYGKDNKVDCFSNSLQLFRCPQTPVIYAFFPAGDNLEKVGFLVISIKDSNFKVKSNNGCPFFVENSVGNHHRILKLLINPDNSFSGFDDLSTDYCVVGYMLAFSDYCVYWYSLKVHTSLDVRSNSCPIVELVGFKCFQSSSVAHACWSPHLVESVVLLENGDLFLFDLECRPKNKKLEGERLRISWDVGRYAGKNLGSYSGGWLSCEFGWHPRILVVAHSSAVFSIKKRLGSRECEVSCLLEIDMFSIKKNDCFIALAKSGPDDGYYFVVASKHKLLLFDVRNPKIPLLQWEHHLDNLNYISVSRLCELRSSSKEDACKWASESGYCILLGSFLDCKFTTFCYGPDNSQGVGFSKKRGISNTKIPRVSNFCAWRLPSDISLSGRECQCGTCLVRDMSSKEALPSWIDWRWKKDRVMGFGIVDSDLSSQLLDTDNYGGFYLIRLMLSGKLEVQRYRADWEVKHTHKESLNDSDNNLLNDLVEAKYKQNVHYLSLNNLKEYLSRNSGGDAVDSSPGPYDDGHAVSLGDDTDNLSDGAEKMMYTPSSKAVSPDHNLSGVNLMRKRSIPEKEGDNTPSMAAERSQEPPSELKQERPIGEIFDDGCPIELKFEDPEIDFGKNELKIYKWLKAQDLKFQKDLKISQPHGTRI